MILSLIYVAVAVALVLWLGVKYVRGDILGMRPKNYPPGPPALPILGNLHLIKPTDLHFQLQAFAKKYGPIFSLKLGSQTLVVLSSPQAVKDLLDKRSHIYSARQDFFIRETGDDLNILMRSNDSVWRGLRKMYHLRLNATVVDQYIPYQDFESRQLLRDILETPDFYRDNIIRFTTSLASTIVYGWRTTSTDLPAVKTMFEWIERYAAVAGQAQIMDWYPVLRPLFRRLPANLFKIQDELIRINKIEDTLWISQLEGVKTSIKEKKLSRSFCRDLLIHNVEGKDHDSEKDIAYACGHAWAGATDTTGNTIQAFFKAMLLFPNAQQEAQKELDRVIGPDRLPDWSDRDSLPYIRCVQKELLRWFPTTLFGGMPHCVTKDDFYMGYKIPAGAGVMNMVYAINNDPERVPNPREFDPTRYTGDDTTSQESAVLSDSDKRDHHTFGAGRRICPGIHVAERSLFITISRLLWAFEVTPYINSAGEQELPELEAVTQGFIVHPIPFKCTIRPRGGEMRAQKIRQSWSEVEHFIDQTGAYKEEFFKTFAKASE